MQLSPMTPTEDWRGPIQSASRCQRRDLQVEAAEPTVAPVVRGDLGPYLIAKFPCLL